MNADEHFMKRCLQLARNGQGTTYPNPMVGCVIVHEGSVLGEGWHEKAGAPHAEVNAINQVRDKSLLRESTLYVNLEPCSHFGRTPPCANLIVKHKIPRVVIGSQDPNEKVAGKGIATLQESNTEVLLNVLEAACDELNKRFFTYHRNKRPFVILKWAQTNDGFIAPPIRKAREPVWITSKASRQRVHKLRAQEQAILVGTKTALEDNPSLTTRDWQGGNPLRIVLDRDNKLPEDLCLKDGLTPTLIYTSEKVQDQPTLKFEQIDFDEDILPQIFESLYNLGIQSLVVEGGAKTLESFITANLWDEAYIFTGADTFKEGIRAPEIHGALTSEETIGRDLLQIYKNVVN